MFAVVCWAILAALPVVASVTIWEACNGTDAFHDARRRREVRRHGAVRIPRYAFPPVPR